MLKQVMMGLKEGVGLEELGTIHRSRVRYEMFFEASFSHQQHVVSLNIKKIETKEIPKKTALIV